MKKIIPALAAICLFHTAIAQQAPLFVNNPYPKTISVSGSASMEIIPDEIYVNVELSEYQKKGDPKKDIETIKTQFLESCKAIGVPDSLVSIVSYSGNNNYYLIRKKKKNNDLLANITYQVKFKSSKLMDDLVEKLDDNATQRFRIVSVNHSNIIEFRKQLKIKAIEAAKEKGIYLTEAIGEKLGEAITINEPEEWQPPSYENNYNGPMSNSSYGLYKLDSVTVPAPPEVDFKKLKLRYEVSIVFALK
ncbi:MAG: SIMPL domain-containing protein [Bacteroidota bacterium]|nr:SIMPL domain-containing protein [Bacteroidota bacterium]